jgi:hypothetical protein
MSDRIIFAYGIFVTLLMLAGLIYDIFAFRKMGRHAEKQRPARYRVINSEKENSNP